MDSNPSPFQKRTFNNLLEEDQEALNMQAKQLQGSFRSKKDLHKWFSEHCQFCLPPYNEAKTGKQLITQVFMKQILAGSKKPLFNSELKNVNVPRYPELSTQKIYLEVSLAD